MWCVSSYVYNLRKLCNNNASYQVMYTPYLTSTICYCCASSYHIRGIRVRVCRFSGNSLTRYSWIANWQGFLIFVGRFSWGSLANISCFGVSKYGGFSPEMLCYPPPLGARGVGVPVCERVYCNPVNNRIYVTPQPCFKCKTDGTCFVPKSPKG